jgi:TolA-binding protein
LTVQQAEQYIQENTGRPGTPYFAEIYLRLGELYEQNGDTKDAMDVYQSYASQFPDRPDLIKQAQQHLAKLQSQTQ